MSYLPGYGYLPSVEAWQLRPGDILVNTSLARSTVIYADPVHTSAAAEAAGSAATRVRLCTMDEHGRRIERIHSMVATFPCLTATR